MNDSLADWLALLEERHRRKIDLGLDRVRQVLAALDLLHPPFDVITVAGTNGKGSSVAMLSAIYERAGYLTGAYTSPHLIRYNERIAVADEPLDDARIVDVFRTVETARGEVSLSYFEFSTVAALVAFRRLGVQVAILEVGLGGRLDAVNAIDAAATIVTSIGLDHQEWLGEGREAIGAEKAAVFRAGRPAVIGDPTPPQSVLTVADDLGACVLAIGSDFSCSAAGDHWAWHGPGRSIDGLPSSSLAGPAGLRNASSVLAVVDALRDRLPVSDDAIREGLGNVRLEGRFQRLSGEVDWVLDVAHNGEAAGVLAEALAGEPVAGRTLAVVGMMGDKPVEAVAKALCSVIDGWFAATPDGERAIEADVLAGRLSAAGRCSVESCGTVVDACRKARAAARPGDRIVVFGSFYTVGPALAWLRTRPDPPQTG